MMLCVPAVENDVGQLACPDDKLALQSVAVPSLKITVPVGANCCGVTDMISANSVTDCATSAGFGALDTVVVDSINTPTFQAATT